MPTTLTPEQILAALYELTQPLETTSRWDQGYRWAAVSARQIIQRTYIPFNLEAHNLEAIDKALRAWIAEGPDYDSRDYNRGCEAGQEAIQEILDGHVGEVIDLLDMAQKRAAKLHREAVRANA